MFLGAVLIANRAGAATPPDGRYGPFNLFDARSKYGTNFFPEPLGTDEMDADQEFRLNYNHTENRNLRTDEASAEVEKSIGLLTLELEVIYTHEGASEHGATDNTDGLGPIELSARHPFYQYVSGSGDFDLTLGARAELAIATGSDSSQNTEFVGALYETLALGDHFSIQSNVGWSTLFGPGEAGGAQVLEYAVVLGYNIPISGTLDLARITPVLEMDGETGLNHGESGNTLLTGIVGANISFESIGIGQPKLLLGYVFPLNDNARDELDWGLTASAVLEY